MMRVHTLDDLALSAPEGKRLVVLGDPVAHSLSPAMHNAALAQMAQAAPELGDWRYEAVHVPAEGIGRALTVLHGAGVRGINLTIPHKVRVLDLLEEVDALAGSMGAVNTLIRTETGYRGTNTDGFGILKAINEAFGRDPGGADVWIFGAGGAARGIIVACLDAGARRVSVVNRSAGRLSDLEGLIKAHQTKGIDRIRFIPLDSVTVDADADAILINATSLGLKADDPVPVPDAFLEPGAVVYDTTYGAANRLAQACSGAAVPYADGLAMLVWQGVRSLEIWTGKPVPAQTMREAAERALMERSGK
jgi:shikimate dehydrogenase